jgi:NADPH:quinone reductase-like Zn-dependent oxidoreductase
MRAVVITRHGPPDVLEVQERPDPRPAAGQVLLEVRAAGVNFADLMARVGLYREAPPPPCVVGYELAGTVAAVGEGVVSPAVGDRVVAWTRFGGYVDRIALPAGDTLPLPEHLSFEQGAAIPVAYATAWTALETLRAGERVLIHAAAGGVGIAATQIARARGAEVHGTASPGKHEAIRGFGVDHAHTYEDRDLPPMDVVLDALGGRSFRRSYDLLQKGGRLVCFGASGVMSGERRNVVAAVRTALRMPRFGLIGQMQDSKAVIGLNMLALWDHRGTLAPLIEPLSELLADGTLSPVVSDAVPFERAPDAHRLIGERRNVGKVVLVP